MIDEIKNSNEKGIPKVYDSLIHEKKWQKAWEEWQIYKFDEKDLKRPTYSIDTPPPYPSGEFHMGNALNWCYFDFVARYKRMRGYNVHFPQGWDCHGLPTEVRVETIYKVRKKDLPIKEFIDLCIKLTEDYIEKMKNSMKSMGYSIDWSLEYKTMDPEYYKKTQLSFVLLYKKGYLYREEHPVNWCPRCETAIAEAEVEYVEDIGDLVYIGFYANGKELTIATTRPELLPACVAIAINPSDERYKEFINKEAIVPIFNRKVPIIADEDVDPKFGSGVVMICTFGDKTDVRWQKKYKLPIIKAITEDGFMSDEVKQFKGLTIQEFKDLIIEELKKRNLIKKIEKIKRNIGTCWRCHTPVEIISKLQWFMKTMDMAEKVIYWTNKIKWTPHFAKKRMIDWTKSLDWDWVISRQRVFATPIPVWYCKNCKNIIVADENWLPVDPRFEKPKINSCEKCGSKEFDGEMDVMDTWMDSSITCAVHAGWPNNLSLFERLFPADLQPNGLDIIRTWDYYLMVKHLALFDKPPYKTVLVNGMVRGTDGRMMHKSFGNYVEASEAIQKYGADSLRQWAAGGGATGYDILFRWSDIEYGKKFLTKLWNAARLILVNLEDYNSKTNKIELELIDRWLLSKLQNLIKQVTDAYENFQFFQALESIRNFTWHVFCDHYIEAVKYRLYSKESDKANSRKAAQYTLCETLYRIIQLLAPICPHITESIYQALPEFYKESKSIHLSKWPNYVQKFIDKKAEKEGELILSIISEVRKEKSRMRLSLKEPIKKLIVYAKNDKLKLIKRNSEAIISTLNIMQIEFENLTPKSEGKSIENDVKIKIEF
jgi:valyl-tRNA synthetase